MEPNLAQVLNTLAHEIRTPLAVSQGYVKLYLDGRLTTPGAERRAMEQTREALGQISRLCLDMGKVGALSEAPDTPMMETLPVGQLIGGLQAVDDVKGAAWHVGPASPAAVATSGATDLIRAVAIVARAAFDEARSEPPTIAVEDAEGGSALTLLAGIERSLAPLRLGPGDANARPFDVARGGKGLTLIWAWFVLRQHRVQIWNHREYRASVGFRFPLVQV